jgi:hypothetical protein
MAVNATNKAASFETFAMIQVSTILAGANPGPCDLAAVCGAIGKQLLANFLQPFRNSRTRYALPATDRAI